MKVLKGITAASGLAKGITCLYTEKVEENIPHYLIESERVAAEIERLKEAYRKAHNHMDELHGISRKMFGPVDEEIFKAHRMILEDETLFAGIGGLIRSRLINAEHAVYDTFSDYIEKLKSEGAHFTELVHDLLDIRNRILTSLGSIPGHFECPVGERQPVIVVAKRLTPSMVLTIPREHALAFVTEEGGFTTHATILARNYGVPVIFNIDIERHIGCGDKVIVDGASGKVIVGPDKSTEDYYASKIATTSLRKSYCVIKRADAAKTKRGRRIKLSANISTPAELKLLKDIQYDGIGLLRSEFLFAGRDQPPSEEEWFKTYKDVFGEVGSKPVVVRLIDIGQDKLPSYLSLPHQENPDLGLRGARAIEIFKDLYLAQIKGILRASVYGDIRILYPMISDLSDVVLFRDIVKEARAALRREKEPFRSRIREGVMIETPAAAIMAEGLLRDVDFANIGSNDLIQYTIAAARGNQLIEKRYHILHPSLVKLMESVVKTARKLKKEVCLCGEIAGFGEFYPVLLSIGLTSFSVAPSKLGDIKCDLLFEEKYDKSVLKRFYELRSKDEIDRFILKSRT
ncbi:MAG: phosphoenolpyruvate--protein phosphotransferase [Candidatus Omnitrophica bacterium]|nr:phosphoenolpyruvate--protein phosphotransferase [Candidatus Omnitrophota bacterium]